MQVEQFADMGFVIMPACKLWGHSGIAKARSKMPLSAVYLGGPSYDAI